MLETRIQCPCGSTYTHHGRVIVQHRPKEDGPSGWTVVNGDADIENECPDDAVGEWSARRGSVSIEFGCELCPRKFAISLIQHKGETFIRVTREIKGREPAQFRVVDETMLTDENPTETEAGR